MPFNFDYDQALQEAWPMMTVRARKETLERMRRFDPYRKACADFLEAAFDVESEIILPGEEVRKV